MLEVHMGKDQHGGTTVPPDNQDGSAVWAFAVQAIQAKHAYATVTDDELRLVLAFDDHGLRVGIRVEPVNSYGEFAIRIAADLGPASDVDAWDALQLNPLLSFGSLGIVHDVLVLSTVIRDTTPDEDTLDDHIQHLAAEAAEIKGRLQVVTPSGAEFSHYST